MDPSQILPLLDRPVVVLVAVGALFVLPKIFPVLSPIAAPVLAWLLKRAKPAAPATPASPAVPAGPPPVDTAPPAPVKRPLADLSLRILAAIAARRYPHLTQEEATERFLVQEASNGYYHDDQVREKEALAKK
ncbi:unnamed protein product [Gemmataceae bacterium]|nr:unnamed protein product [Gemmataceae bacterium]VTU02767.1 unnamed protein product [Gemmataceae bacterium]